MGRIIFLLLLPMNYRAYAAELLSTAVLTTAVLVTAGSSPTLATPIAAALTVALFVYTIGAISGAHINPAVTIGLLSVGKVKMQDAIYYIIAQFLGAIIALKVLMKLGVSKPALTVVDSGSVAFGEVLGAFLLVFGICSVVYGKVSDAASGLVIGGSLLLGIVAAASFSNGVLNPAVALGIGSLSLTYIIAPVIGAVAAAHLYKWMSA